MKKIPLLITLAILLSLIAGYYSYQHFFNKKPISVWDLVPADALVVYEKNNCGTCVEELSKSSLLTIVERAAFYKRPVDSIRTKLNGLLKSAKGILISAHATKKDDFDFVYYLPNDNSLDADLALLQRGKYKLTARMFNEIQIKEIRFVNQVFSFAIMEGIWIGSFTPFLVEDVIRTYKTRSDRLDENRQAQRFSTIQDDAGNLFVKLDFFSDLIRLFYPAPSSSFNYPLGVSSLLDIKSNENSLILNGFSFDSINQEKFVLSIFRHQAPVSFGLKHLISNRTIAFSSYGVSEGNSFYADLQRFVQKKHKSAWDTLEKISSTYKLGIEKLYGSISDEFGVAFLESSKGKKLTRILLVETKSADQWLKTFNSIAEKLSVDTIFYEKYSQYDIREVPVFKFSEKLLWPFVNGFEQNFYTSAGNVILIADDLEELKNYLNDIDADDTWGKSVSQNRFLESTLLESNVSLYTNSARALNVLARNFHPKWIGFVKENHLLMQSLQMSSIQFSHLNNSYYTNVILNSRPVVPDKGTTDNKRIITNFDQGVATLQAVKSHIDRSNEILIQDSINDLSLIGSEGKVLWKLSIGDRIISDITQVDFFNNGKLQYFFATQNSIHIIDRLGNYVDPYPLHLPAADIEHVSVIDYDNSKKYRILISEHKGKLWMYDKEGNLLDGWNPKEVGGSLAMPPRHHRIKGKDYILSVRRDGRVLVTNRRGENLKKYPVNIESIPSGDHMLEVGSTLSDTYFVLVSRDGFKIKLNVEGEIQGRETLLKTAVTSNFSLICEKANKSYLILQQDSKQLTLMEESGKKILTSTITGVQSSDIKYYDFGSGNVFIILVDRSQGLSYIYDGQGNLVTNLPIETTAIEIRPLNNDQFRMFFIHGRALVMQTL